MNLLRRIERPFGNLVSDFFDSDFLDRDFLDLNGDNYIPAVNVKDNEKSYQLEVAAPGMDKEDFEVSIDDNVLFIKANHSTDSEEKEEGYTRKEFSYRTFERSFRLPDSVDEKGIKAEYKKGVLWINVPKSKATQKKSKKLISIA